MPKYLLKPELDKDFYVDWSTIVETALAWGTRDDMTRYGFEKDRLDRCDQYGTSAYWFRPELEGSSGKDGEIYRQSGWLRYNQMRPFLEELVRLWPGDRDIPDDHLDTHPELRKFLEPLES